MKRPEEQLQRSVVAYLKIAAPSLLWFAIPNGGFRTKAEAGIMKAMGQRAGVADLCVICPDGTAAFIELKAAGGTLSPAQMAFREDAAASKASYMVCRSLKDVEFFLRLLRVPLRSQGVA